MALNTANGLVQPATAICSPEAIASINDGKVGVDRTSDRLCTFHCYEMLLRGWSPPLNYLRGLGSPSPLPAQHACGIRAVFCWVSAT